MNRCRTIALVAAAACLMVGMAVSTDAAPANPFAPLKPKQETPATGERPAPAAEKKEQPPEARAIRGRFSPPDRVVEAHLVERSMDLKIPVQVDKTTGAFEVKGLRLGTYDFIIRTPWGRLEGIDMEPKVSPYDILIPSEYRTPDLGLRTEGEFTDKDRAAIRRTIHEVKRYENKVTDMMISGSADVAVVLVELMMDTAFHSRKGDEITWRIEQWSYEKKYDAWMLFKARCLYRFRVSKAEWQTWGWQFEPRLGGLVISEDLTEPVKVEFTIPERPTREKGVPGSKHPPADKGRTW
jgi:hypothetical protein